jgi:hypothetical protein
MDKTKIVCFGEKIAGTDATTPKSVLSSISGEDSFSVY